jgi:iron complex outermembrane recepter protein
MVTRTGRVVCVLGAAAAVLMPPVAAAQTASTPLPVSRFALPPVIVTAEKMPADAQRLPVSVTAVSGSLVESAGIASISEASVFSPNTHFADLSARKVSNPFIRGIGASPANPAVTTYIDGVPQLNANSSSIELLDIEQIEFVRGPQSALFGRNTLAGVVNVASARPSLSGWTGSFQAPLGSDGARALRGSLSGPLGGRLAVGLSVGRSERNGFTVNDVTGHDLDSRTATFGKAQALWIPADTWEARAIVSVEQDRDGDYALGDLGALRTNPFHVSRDFEGRTRRDIVSTAFRVRHEGSRVAFLSTTGLVRWETDDLTDLDYTAMPLVTRENAEEARQFTQEVQLASSAKTPIRLSDRMNLRWQGGAFFFSQAYSQAAVNEYAPYVLSPFVPVAVSHWSPQASLDDLGLGLYGQGTVTFSKALEARVGARVDHERKDALIRTTYSPEIAPPVVVDEDQTFTNVSPQLAVAYPLGRNRMLYLSAGRGFKAGGFNAASPAGSEAYGEEHTWNLEGGLKATFAGGRVSTSAAAFHLDWRDMQLNVPNPSVPGQFYIANVAGARSSGVEVEVRGRPHPRIDLTGSLGMVHAHFASDSVSSGVDVAGNRLPNTPGYTAAIGAQWSRPLAAGSDVFARGDLSFFGSYRYDDANREGQGAYSLADFRAGVNVRSVRVEAWVKNAFDTRYIPVAFAYGNLAPSGFIGEMGRPRTFGLTAGVTF